MTPEFDMTQMTPADHAALMDAVRRLEHTGVAMRLSNMLGRELNELRKYAPEKLADAVDRAALSALRMALRVAISSLGGAPAQDRRRAHRLMVVASGAAGGAFGLASLPVELPLTTTLMLRAIADIARAEGEDLAEPEAALACLEVFALDGRAPSANVTDSGYFAVRSLLARTVSDAARFVASRGVADETAPILIRLVAIIAKRFGVVAGQKFVAQAAPALGAVGGAAINLAFIEHFQSLAKGHFTVRRLERKYGQPFVRLEYERISSAREPDQITSPAA